MLDSLRSLHRLLSHRACDMCFLVLKGARQTAVQERRQTRHAAPMPSYPLTFSTTSPRRLHNAGDVDGGGRLADDSAEAAADALCRAAYEAGSRDNLTALCAIFQWS